MAALKEGLQECYATGQNPTVPDKSHEGHTGNLVWSFTCQL
jgi:hypothetical protein